MNYSKMLELIEEKDSISSTRCTLYARAAEKEGKAHEALFFRTIAYSKMVHARQCKIFNRKLSNFEKNLELLVSEEEETREELTTLLNNAIEEGEETDKKHLAIALVEVHAIYSNLVKEVASHRGLIDRNYYVCEFCGLIARDNPPQICPICQAENAFTFINNVIK